MKLEKGNEIIGYMRGTMQKSHVNKQTSKGQRLFQSTKEATMHPPIDCPVRTESSGETPAEAIPQREKRTKNFMMDGWMDGWMDK